MPATVKTASGDESIESPRGSNLSLDPKLSTIVSDQKLSSKPQQLDTDEDSIAGDDFGSVDEVKVFKDEDEPEGQCSESYQAELLAEKSSLINESEQTSKGVSTHSFPFGDKELQQLGSAAAAAAFAAGPGKYFDPSFSMGYLMSPYTAAYANGFAGAHMGRPGSPLPPFFYGDPLSSPPPPPPPAHMGTLLDKGLRSPLYPLSQAQYPYSMIGPDQLAAWHQASVYQSGSQRPGSPYSLTMSAAGGASAISRFSSFGLLGSAGHLPHGKRDFDGRPGKDSSPMKKKEPHIKKPLNAFMLYMKEMRPVVQAECTLKESAAINQILGRRWHTLSEEAQSFYYAKAEHERQLHKCLYPNWTAKQNYCKLRVGGKKQKKRDNDLDPSSPSSTTDQRDRRGPNSKKCRALYGVDQHNLWCKPCRRKKKCIRIQMSARSRLGKGHHHHTGPDLISDDEDEDYDSRSGPTDSLSTASEPSMTSPLGYGGGLSNMGSPCSPLMTSSITSLGDEWGSFHRLSSSLSSIQNSSQSLISRAPVGTDPRDFKNPLSIWQLTGRSGGQHRPPVSSLANDEKIVTDETKLP